MNKDPKQEVDEELRFHLEQRTRDYIARGMSPEAAREAAAQRFGDTARVREACASVLLAERAAEERRAFVKVSWLDVKLGLRMLAKYPGLSLVAVGGMAIASRSALAISRSSARSSTPACQSREATASS